MGLLVTLAIVVLFFLVGALIYLQLEERGYWDEFPDNLKAKIAEMRGESGSEAETVSEASFAEADAAAAGAAAEPGTAGTEGAIDKSESADEGRNESAGAAADEAAAAPESFVEGEPSADDHPEGAESDSPVENKGERGYSSMADAESDTAEESVHNGQADPADEAALSETSEEVEETAREFLAEQSDQKTQDRDERDERDAPDEPEAAPASDGFGVIKRGGDPSKRETGEQTRPSDTDSPTSGTPLGIEIGRRDEHDE